jgi:cell division protein ZapA
MMASPRLIEIHILGRAYRVACKPDEEAALIAAAEYLDQKMREIREGTKVIGAERIAIMAGLNLAHEVLTQSGPRESAATRTRVVACTALLDAVLAEAAKVA